MMVTGPPDMLLALSVKATLFFCKYPHFHARAVSSVHRAGARSPENGDKDHADVRGCATHHTLEMKFCLPPQKKYQTRERVGAATEVEEGPWGVGVGVGGDF